MVLRMRRRGICWNVSDHGIVEEEEGNVLVCG